MNLLITFLFASVFYIRSLKNSFFKEYISKKYSLLAKKKNDLYGGFDCRYNLTSVVNTTQLNNFTQHLKKLYMINILKDESVSAYTKLNMIKNYSNNNNNYEYNLYAGGLIDEFHLFILDQ